jgi:hypothetical protein
MIRPREDLHQRALAGAVLAHEGVDFAGPDAEIDALENTHARKALANPAHFQNRPSATLSSLCTGRHCLW